MNQMKMFRWALVLAGASSVYFAGMLRAFEFQAEAEKKAAQQKKQEESK